MDYMNVIKAAASKQSNEGATKRYSLAVGPPKKDPKVKGVQSAAVQAFLRRKEDEIRLKELEEKRKKEDLLMKRKELKHDKKARAMASRTKDNFRGYNGIPVEEKPRKRSSADQNDNNENSEYLTEEELYEYSPSESEQEEIEEPSPPPPPAKKTKLSGVKKAAPPPAMNFAELLRLAEKKQYEPVEIIKPVKKNDERPRTAEELREIEFLERKNQRPSKPNCQIIKVSKSSSEKHSSSKGSHSEDKKVKSSSSTQKSGHHDKIQSGESGPVKKHSDLKHKSEKHSSVSHSKIIKVTSHGNSKPSSSKEMVAKPSSSRPDMNGKLQGSSQPSSTSSSSMKSSGASGKQSVSSGPSTLRPSGVSSSSRSSGASTSSSGQPSGSAVTPSARPTSTLSSSKLSGSSASARPSGNAGSARPSGNAGSARPSVNAGSAHPSVNAGSARPSVNAGSACPSVSSGSARPSGSSVHPSSGYGSVKPHISSGSSLPNRSGQSASSSGPARPSSVSSQPAAGNPLSASKPKGIPSGKKEGPSMRPNGGPTMSSSKLAANSGPGRPGNHSTMGTGFKPKCTVVSETISSKNFVAKSSNGPVNGMRPGQVNGMRPGQINGTRPGQVNGMRPGPPPGHRPMARPPGPPLPPITSAYKRRIDDEEYDSEMEDFIDDGGESQDEISKHIREIFGYDRSRYKDESDYALRYMESSFREQQKEEARSLRLGIQEDLEELKREEEELKRKAMLEKAKKKLKKQ